MQQPPSITLLTVATLLAAATLAACGESASADCRTGGECASGVCESSGRCRPVAADTSDASTGFDSDTAVLIGVDSEAGDSTAADGSDGADAPDSDNPENDVAVPDVLLDPDAVSLTCTPNHDFIITRAEAPFPVGATVTYRTAKDATVDMVGTEVEGLRHWSLSGSLPGDEPLPVTTEALDDQWFAKAFPDATYTARLAASAPLLGVFQLKDDALLLHGVVSPNAGTFRTELTYDPPVKVLPFPLAEGDSWVSESAITGTAEGFGCFGCTERYTSKVDAIGALETPFGTFRVLRVRVELDRTVAGVTQTTRTFLFVSECFATVAAVVSAPGETAIEFDTAAEVRRIAPE